MECLCKDRNYAAQVKLNIFSDNSDAIMKSFNFLVKFILALGWKRLTIVSDSDESLIRLIKDFNALNIGVNQAISDLDKYCNLESVFPLVFLISSSQANAVYYDCITRRRPYHTLLISKDNDNQQMQVLKPSSNTFQPFEENIL